MIWMKKQDAQVLWFKHLTQQVCFAFALKVALVFHQDVPHILFLRLFGVSLGSLQGNTSQIN